MVCQNCKSSRIAEVGGKCSDMSNVYIEKKSTEGYLPNDLGIGGGDYIDFNFCLDCGQMQGTFPLPITELESSEDEDENNDDDKEW